MPLNILIICHYFPPLHSIASLRPYSFAKYWTEKGHFITVLTTAKAANQLNLPKIPNLKIIDIDYKWREVAGKFKEGGSSFSRSSKDNLGRTLIKKIVIYLRSTFGILAAERIPEIIMPWVIPARKYIKKHMSEFDVIVAEYSPPSALYLGVYAKKCSNNRAKLIFDYRDSWTVSNYSQPGFPLIRYLERFIENKFIKHADLISSTQRGISNEFNSRGYQNTLIVENGFFDDLEMENLDAENDEIAIVYTGSYGGYRSIDFLEDTLNIIQSKSPNLYEKINIYILGDGTTYVNHPKIIIKGKVSYEESLQYQKRASILFLVESGEEVAKYNIPGKFFEYFKYKTPIIAFGPKSNFEISKYLIKHKIGLVSDASCLAASNSILEVINNRSNYLGNELEQFSRKRKAQELLNRIEALNV